VIAGLPVHLLSPPIVARMALPRSAVEMVGAVLEGALARSAPSLVIAPAGIATVESEAEALEEAERIRVIARRTGTALLFGIDVGPPQPGSGRLFACLGGAPVLWPAIAERAFPKQPEARLVRVGGAKILPLFAAEALDPTSARRIVAMGGVDAVLILSHGGATDRWNTALARLERVTPVAVASHHGGAGRGYASPRLGVTWLSVGLSGPPLSAAA